MSPSVAGWIRWMDTASGAWCTMDRWCSCPTPCSSSRYNFATHWLLQGVRRLVNDVCSDFPSANKADTKSMHQTEHERLCLTFVCLRLADMLSQELHKGHAVQVLRRISQAKLWSATPSTSSRHALQSSSQLWSQRMITAPTSIPCSRTTSVYKLAASLL